MIRLNELPAAQAASLIASGEISAQALVQSCLDRIAERDREVQAWAYLDPAYALHQAKDRDAAQRAGATLGALHGVPVGIKDIIDTADMPTQHGCAMFKDNQPAQDAAVISALRQAGAVILGKTVTTELANNHPGKTSNPHNPAHTPGGSSSGSAAGVAAGMMPLALATQTGGSVIRPASFCGVHALKPTFGLIPRPGVLMQSHTLDTVGVYGRSVEDLALITDVLAGYDARDPDSYPRGRANLVSVSREVITKPPRFAFVKSSVWDEGEPAMQAALTAFAKGLGGQCVDVALPPIFTDAKAWHYMIMGAEDAKYYGPLMDRAPDLLSAAIKERLHAGRKVTAVEYLNAIAMRDVLYGEIANILDQYDAMLTPASAGPAPKGLGWTGNPAFNAIWTYLGVPCVTLPLLKADGLPLGVQLVGKRREDGKLLRTAHWLDVRGAA